MSGASAKARWYLEAQVSELQDFVKRKVFTKDEVSQIAKKRSEFEHIINGRGAATPREYARYAEYEMNLRALCQKRMARRKIQATQLYWGDRQIYFVLDRGVRKFPGDMRLWMQYIEFSRSRKAHRKLKEVLTSCLRLHPHNSDLWVYAAGFMLHEEADMTGARAYMQRGLRFCQNMPQMWLQYAKLEMIYIAKIAARRKILGLDGNGKRKRTPAEEEEDELHDKAPQVTVDDINPNLQQDAELDEAALKTLENTLALTGAIPLAIFDAAMKQFRDDTTLEQQFFDLVSDFPEASCSRRILQHIIDHAERLSSVNLWKSLYRPRFLLFGVEAHSSEYPSALGKALRIIQGIVHSSSENEPDIVANALRLLVPHMNDNHDPDIQKVLRSSIRGLAKSLGPEASIEMINEWKRTNKRNAQYLCRIGHKLWPEDERYLDLDDGIVDAEQKLPANLEEPKGWREVIGDNIDTDRLDGAHPSSGEDRRLDFLPL